MKRGIILYILQCIGLALFLNSCDDNLTKVGTTIQPPGDLITVYTDTFMMKASTVRLDSVFSKTSDFMIGEMYDPVYGTIKADILCQFYCEEDFKFPRIPINGKIDSVELSILLPLNENNGLMAYGDTLSPMEMTVYLIDRPLKRNFYTNDHPENYCDMKNPLGKTAYTAYNLSIPDSIRQIEYPHITVKLPTELGQRFYDETIQNPSTFVNQNTFNEFFPGIYITNTYGSGCIIKTSADNIYLHIYYDFMDKDIEGNDSIVHAAQFFTVSKEVIQINRFVNDNIDPLLVENPTHTYIKSPAAVCTKLVIPTSEMAKKFDVSDRYINGFTLDLKYLPEDEWDYACQPPAHLLLLPEDSIIPFFEKGSVENYMTSFISFASASASSSNLGYNPNTRTYHFGNISNLLKVHITNSPDKDLNLYAIPVTRKATEDLNYGLYYTTAISHSFYLSGVKIRTENEYMKVVVLSSKFEM